MADYLCIDRSALTRELNNMKKDGLLDFDKNTFHLYLLQKTGFYVAIATSGSLAFYIISLTNHE